MSDGFDGVIQNLPDVWFDWYARLLPGCFGVGLFLYLSSNIPAATGVHVVLFLLVGYGLGHVLQPTASFVVRRLEKRYNNEETYAKAKRDGTRPSLLNKVSKAHAEANSMFAFGLALLLNIVYFGAYFWNSPISTKCFAFLPLIYFVLATLQRTWSRNEKIEDLKSDRPAAA